MKQRDKNQLSREKILSAAIAEFGTKNFESASLNNICSDNNISKGLIYHYFKNKDDLFLSCVKSSYDALVEYLSKENFNKADFQSNMKKYIDLRYQFFKDNPFYSHIFFTTVLQPPLHLKEQIKELRKEFDEFNINRYKMDLSNLTLRDDVSEDEAIEYFYIFQEMFNGYFQSKAYENTDFESLIEAHEVKLSKILNIMLYGIAKEKTEK